MSKSKIQWTDATWNPVAGCAKVSAGCKHCYAESMAHRNASIGRGPTATKGQKANGAMYGRVLTDRGKWNGTFLELPDRLSKPLRWRKPRSIFVNSMSDLFGEGVSFEFIAAVFAIMACTKQHKYQILTKRPERARAFFAEYATPGAFGTVFDRIWAMLADIAPGVVTSERYHNASDMWPLENVMMGVSAENQATWDERVPVLLELPAVKRFVSVEPMLGPINPAGPLYNGRSLVEDLDLAIMGCESRGSNLGRPTQLAWVQSLGKAVLDAQTWDVECKDPDLAVENGPPRLTGPALFFKQGDVCQKCYGGTQQYKCIPCGAHLDRGGTGRAGKLIKLPRIKFDGHPAQSYEQQPEGW